MKQKKDKFIKLYRDSSPPHGGRELETFCVRTPTLSCSFAHTRGRELKLSSEVYDTYHLWSPPHGGRELKRERIDLILNFFSSPPSRGRELKPLCYYYSKFVKEVRHPHGGREL